MTDDETGPAQPADAASGAANRRVGLEGPGNIRDLGGLPTADGAVTASGLVFRSDRLSSLSDADLVRLESLGVRHVIDLRSEGEAQEFPDRLPAGASYLRLSMTSDDKLQSRTIFDRIKSGELTRYGEPEMVDGYTRILSNFPQSFARIARQVGRGEPLIVHCTAGKDRTGLAAMLLLDLAGVAGEEIVADYALSAARRRSLGHDHTEESALRPLMLSLGLDPEGFEPLWGSIPSVMEATLDRFRRRWNNADGYLAAAGMDAAERADARARLRA